VTNIPNRKLDILEISNPGTMSLNEIAVDLTCESADFEPASSLSATAEGDEDEPVPGQFRFPTEHYPFPSSSSFSHPRYHVHSGMLRMARAMGDVGKPVQLAVHEALYRNPDYG
jgi:sn1-specific diacylglycerol lipase